MSTTSRILYLYPSMCIHLVEFLLCSSWKWALLVKLKLVNTTWSMQCLKHDMIVLFRRILHHYQFCCLPIYTPHLIFANITFCIIPYLFRTALPSLKSYITFSKMSAIGNGTFMYFLYLLYRK